MVSSRFFVGVAAVLLLVSGCSGEVKSPAPKSSESTAAATTSAAAATTSASTSPSGTASAAPGAAKETFCNDVNRAVTIFESPGTTLTEGQSWEMVQALQNALRIAPTDVSADFTAAITALVADVQATGDAPNLNSNGRKVAEYTTAYCG